MTPNIILASNSPRRRELLAQIGIPFLVAPANVDESVRDGETPRDYAEGKGAAPGRAATATLANVETARILQQLIDNGDRS